MTQQRSYEVSGMSCTDCESTVETALSDLDGVRRVEADHEAGTVEVEVEDQVSDDDVNAAVRDAGYEVVA